MRLLYTFVFFVGVTSACYAQQDAIYAQYLMNPLILNPSYAGINNNMQLNAGYRIQWMGLDASPRTVNLNGSVSLIDNKVGAGVSVITDKIGNTSVTEFNAVFSYKLKFQNNMTFSFGMQGGMLGVKTNNSSLNIFDPTDPLFEQGTTNTTKPNIGTGITLMGEKFIAGLSVPKMLPTKINFGGQPLELYTQHYYLFGSYVHILNERLRFKPSVLLRGVKGAPLSADVALNLNLNLVHTVGLFTRNLNTYGVVLQTMFAEKFRLGYVFELPTTKSVGAQFTTHEISLGMRMGVLEFHERSLTNF